MIPSTLHQNINIDIDEKRGKFIIHCPFHHNNLIKNMPNRRFDAKRKVWVAPAIRHNFNYIKSKLDNNTTVFSPAALEYLKGMENKYTSTGTISNLKKFPVWHQFKTTPRPAQQKTLDVVYDMDMAALLIDMRVGKTKIIIDLASAYFLDQKIEWVLIVCLYSITDVWVNELKKHCPIDYDAHVLDTSNPKKFDKWLNDGNKFKWLIVGVESLSQGSAIKYCEKYTLCNFNILMVVDESYKIANPSAISSNNCVKLGRNVKKRIIMTGSMSPNGLINLYMQYEFLSPDIIGIGDYYSFRNRYCVMGGFENKQIIGYQNVDELMELISPYTVRISQSEALDIEPPTFISRKIKLNPTQRELYASLKKKKMCDYDNNTLFIQNSLEITLRYQEIVGGFVSLPTNNNNLGGEKFYTTKIKGENPKINEIINIANDLPCNIIIWARFQPEIQLIVSTLREIWGDDQVVQFHGGNVKTRDDDKLKFSKGGIKFMVANQTVGGAGVDFSAADAMIYYSNTFRYVDRDQSQQRATADGKKNSVLIIDIIAPGTVDELIMEAIIHKKDVSQYIKDNIQRANSLLLGDN